MSAEAMPYGKVLQNMVIVLSVSKIKIPSSHWGEGIKYVFNILLG